MSEFLFCVLLCFLCTVAALPICPESSYTKVEIDQSIIDYKLNVTEPTLYAIFSSIIEPIGPIRVAW